MNAARTIHRSPSHYHHARHAFTLGAILVAFTWSLQSRSYAAELPVIAADKGIVGPAFFKTSIAPVDGLAPPEAEMETMRNVLSAAAANPAAIEDFIAANPNSTYAPSLRVNLGKYYHAEGRSTLALEHWQVAWESTKLARAGSAKEIADFALAHWTRLLANLGRVEALEAIYAEHRDRSLDQGPLSQMFIRTWEALESMKRYPDFAAKCGVFALNEVAKSLNDLPFDIDQVVHIPSPAIGFSMAELAELSEKNALGVIAVERVNGGEIIIPSVIHWRQNHYAAIVSQQDDFYEVIDPAAPHPQWFTAAAIQEEASGYFLIPANRLNANWRRLSQGEAGAILGRAYPNIMVDNDDMGFGGSGWRVSEPYLNVWLEEQASNYQPALGRSLPLQVAYKQRDENLLWLEPGIFGVGKSWNCSFLSYVEIPSTAPWQANVYLGGGGYSVFSLISGWATNYLNNLVLNVVLSGSTVVRYDMYYPDGSKDTYSLFRTDTGGNWSQAFLTQRVDPVGYITTFQYDTYNNQTKVVRLKYVVDPVGKTNTINYVTSNAYSTNLISSVVDPYGRTATFAYSSTGLLTSFADPSGFTRTYTYDANGWPLTMVTSYGTTSFTLTAGPNNQLELNSGINRSALITEANGAKQLFLYREDCSSFMSSPYPSAEIPTGTPLGTLDTANSNYRNSFFWNRKQYLNLSTTVMTNFTANDYRKGRMQHWLNGATGSYQAVDTLSILRAPSPATDGTVEGQKSWYDYDGKNPANPDVRGKQVLPAVVAQVLPGTTTTYQWFSRNTWGTVTRQVDTYTKENGTIGTRTNSFTYASNGIDLLASRGPNNELITGRSYNTKHQVLTATNAVSEVTTSTYDASNRLATRQLPSGLLSTFTYGSDYYASKVVASSGGTPMSTNSFTWLNATPRTTTDPRGLTQTLTYDNLLRPTRIDFSSDASYVTYGYTYLDRTSTRDRLGNVATATYNSVRQLISTTVPKDAGTSETTTYSYCNCGAVEDITNPLSQTTHFDYANDGSLINTLYPDSTTKSYTYNLPGQVIGETRVTGTNSYTYNNQGLRITAASAAGQLGSSQFDNANRPGNVTNAASVTVSNAFDTLNRVYQSTYSNGKTEGFGFTANVAGLTSYTNQINEVTRYTYDAAGRQLTETTPKSEVITYTYNAAGDRLTFQDGKNHLTTANHNSEGRVTSMLDDSGATMASYTYDANGRVVSRYTPAKGTTYFTYDFVGNLTFINYPSSPDVTLTYDNLNRVATMVDGAGTTSYTYTTAGQVATEDGPWASDTVTYTYNNARLRSGLTLQQPSGSWTQTYGYNGAEQVNTTTSGAGTFNYTYQGSSPLITRIDLPNTASIQNTFDTLARLTSTALKNSGSTVLNSHGYTYDFANRRSQQTRTDASYVNYTYDLDSQLASALGYASGGSPIANEQRSYTYDAGWNLYQRTVNGSTSTFSVDNKNQLTTIPFGTCTYDANGNLTWDGQRTYTYDDENRLLSVTVASYYQTQYLYDGRGRLRRRLEYAWSGSFYLISETRYVYDGMLVIQERDGSNIPTVTYTRGVDLSGGLQGAVGIGGLLARSHGYSGGSWSTHNFYHADGSGNVTAMINNSQTSVASYKYDSYGNLLSSTGSLASANLYRFLSKEVSPNSGIYYFGYRFYEPNFQRWLSRDPIGELGPQNLYGFVGNNPVLRFPSFGLGYSGAPSWPPALPPGMPYYPPAPYSDPWETYRSGHLIPESWNSLQIFGYLVDNWAAGYGSPVALSTKATKTISYGTNHRLVIESMKEVLDKVCVGWKNPDEAPAMEQHTDGSFLDAWYLSGHIAKIGMSRSCKNPAEYHIFFTVNDYYDFDELDPWSWKKFASQLNGVVWSRGGAILSGGPMGFRVFGFAEWRETRAKKPVVTVPPRTPPPRKKDGDK